LARLWLRGGLVSGCRRDGPGALSERVAQTGGFALLDSSPGSLITGKVWLTTGGSEGDSAHGEGGTAGCHMGRRSAAVAGARPAPGEPGAAAARPAGHQAHGSASVGSWPGDGE